MFSMLEIGLIRVQVCFLVILGLLNVITGNSLASVQGTGIDLVLLIDQSGSMSGDSIYHPSPNDPYGKRIESVENVVYTLFDSVEGYYGSYGTSPVHQLSIIEFGTNARVAVSARQIEYRPNESHQGRSIRIQSIISLIRPESLGFTDHLKAFTEAKRELAVMKNAGLPGIRKQVVLMVTDGKSYVTGFSEKSYLRRMRTFLRESFIRSGAAIEVLGLNDADNYWKRGCGRYWSTVTDGNAILIRDPSQFYENIKETLGEYLGPFKAQHTIKVKGEDFDCPPYIKLIIVNIDKHQPGASIEVIDPEGRPVNLMSLKKMERRTFSRFYIPRPMPGIWKIRPSMGSCSIEVEVYYTRVALLAPLRPVNPSADISISYQVMSEEGIPFKELTDHPVRAILEITSPDGMIQSFEMTKDKRGIFTNKMPFVPVAPGEYRCQMSARVLTGTGKESVVFQSKRDTIKVTNKKPIQLLLREPLEGEVQPLRLAKGKVSVHLDLIPLGNPSTRLSIVKVARDPSHLVEVSISDDRGKVAGGPLPLRFDGTSLKGDLPVHISIFSWEWLLRRGRHWLRFDVHDGALTDDYYFHSIYRGQTP